MTDARKRFLIVALTALLTGAALTLVVSPEASAQCAMCRATVAAAGERVARTMNAAMLVLLVPPVAIFCTIFAVARGRKNRGGDEREGGA